MTEPPGRRWWLDLAYLYPQIEMYNGGWKAEQELDLIELGQRVLDEETGWLFTTIYSSQRDRTWAAVSYMFAAVVNRIRRERPEEWRVLRALAGEDQRVVSMDEVPAGWRPDTAAWDGRRLP